VSDGDEVKCAGKLFHRLAAKTGKAAAHLPTVARLKDNSFAFNTVGLARSVFCYCCFTSDEVMFL